ncbi:tRNA pseudouridine(55) synthase TruB [Fusobacterium sp. MFO224]|uniref:tRNA pseudouridine(55) synthase TruB n=1 Tax=Fusobacterium sp. MFO224 TaxID=3378070 RepID=UPI0038523611
MNGIINVNKPQGITSFDVIRKLRKILSIRKIGHTGTLDPLATGVLIVCVGKATKLVQDIEKEEKEYIAEFDLGYKTDTYDTEGKVLDKVNDFSITQEQLENVLKHYVGNIKQIPPMYSAIKVNGKKLYELARKGETIERKARDISIFSLDLLKFDGKRVKIKCVVSKGTYIRSLIYDIGEDLKTFATMTSLVRTKVGKENIEKSFTLETIETLKENNDFSFLYDIESYFDYPTFPISGEKSKTLFLNGNTLVTPQLKNGFYKVYDSETNKFLGLSHVVSERLKAYKYY